MKDNALINDAALRVMKQNRVAVFIVAYNASKHIEGVLGRIPHWVCENLAEIYLIDDSSKDETASIAARIDWPQSFPPLRVFKTPFNQGYGGNQKIGYSYAIEQGFDIVVLLHGDGQYAPEALPHILSQYDKGIDAVFGSRFINSGDALKGGMPLYKFVGNRILTGIQNYFMKGNLSEWHSGYRSYRTSLLKQIPFSCNSNDFDFDSEIIIQTLGAGGVIKEIAIPTFYGDEICHVNGMRYAFQCVKNVLQYKTMQAELFYDPRFDLSQASSLTLSRSGPKAAKTSVQHFIENIEGLNEVRVRQISSVLEAVEGDGKSGSQYDIVIALDALQNQDSPELALQQIGYSLKANGQIYVSCANVAYFPVRIMLLLGFFNYGRRGILDRAHKRLFTKGSFKRLLQQGGYEIESIHGFGPPIVDGIGDTWFLSILDTLSYKLAKLWISLFAFQILLVARKKVDIRSLMQKTTENTY